MRDPERAREALNDIKRLGVSIALDKFGSGEHSLGLPRNVPLDFVKLDRGLTGSFDRDKDRRAMFAATIALAKEAGLTAVAVGIETNRQLALARQLDCSVGQGFLLHGPAAAERIRLSENGGALTSPPWRPLVRLGGIYEPLSGPEDRRGTEAPRHAPRPRAGPGRHARRSRAPARRSRTCCRRSPSAA